MGARGEGVLTVGDREVRILFTNRALARAEEALGKSVLEIAQAAANNRLGIGDVARLIQTGIDAARRENGSIGKAATLDDAYHIIDEVGFVTAAKLVIESIAAVLNYEAPEESASPPVE